MVLSGSLESSHLFPGRHGREGRIMQCACGMHVPGNNNKLIKIITNHKRGNKKVVAKTLYIGRQGRHTWWGIDRTKSRIQSGSREGNRKGKVGAGRI